MAAVTPEDVADLGASAGDLAMVMREMAGAMMRPAAVLADLDTVAARHALVVMIREAEALVDVIDANMRFNAKRDESGPILTVGQKSVARLRREAYGPDAKRSLQSALVANAAHAELERRADL